MATKGDGGEDGGVEDGGGEDSGDEGGGGGELRLLQTKSVLAPESASIYQYVSHRDRPPRASQSAACVRG